MGFNVPYVAVTEWGAVCWTAWSYRLKLSILFVISTLIDDVLNYDLRPTGPAILPPVGPTGPPKDEIYA